jgi:hypothetical protein
MTAVSAAYQRARRWKLKPIKKVKARHQEDGVEVVTEVWIPRKVKEDMKPWITPQDIKKADAAAFLKNNP